MKNSTSRRDLCIAAALVAATAVTYADTLGNGFVNFDDDKYVFANRQVKAGLSLSGIRWAFTDISFAIWHPLTWLSLQLDSTLFGTGPAGYHATSLFLHCANSALLFLWLQRATGAVGRSATAAAFFALHPLHVESVAWIAERKDVLSGLFFLLALLAWHDYVCRPSWRRYTIVVAALACGLMSKPMLVTFPCLLLLLDWWPFRRWQLAGEPDQPPVARQAGPRPMPSQPWQRLVAEKLPFVLLVAVASVVTYQAQQLGGAVRSSEQLPHWARLANMPIAYLAYLGKTCWPVRLAAFYPHGEGATSASLAIAAAAFLTCACAGAVASARRWPYFFVGWFWWLGMLVPVIGLVQVGGQAMADRYMYLPLIGLMIAAVWCAERFAAAWRWPAWAMPGLTGGLLLGCALVSRRQIEYWHDGVTLWRHVAEISPLDSKVCNNLGTALVEHNRIDEAFEWLQRGVSLAPNDPRCHFNLGLLYLRMKRTDDSIAEFRAALFANQINQQDEQATVRAHYNLGVLLAKKGDYDEAIDHLRQAVAIDADYWRAHLQLAIALARTGNTVEAERHAAEALRINPDLAHGPPASDE